MLMNWNDAMKQINTNLIKVLSTCLLFSLAVQCCAATTVSIADVTADPEETVTVPLMVNDMTNFGTGTINITYDPSVVHVTNVTDSSDSVIAAFNNDNTAGFTAISASNTVGTSGDIVFANVEFTAVKTGSTPLNVDVVKLYDRSFNEIHATATVDNGLFTSGDVSTSPTPTSTTQSTSSSGGSTTGSVSISTPTATQSAKDGADLASTSEPTSHNDEGADEETGTPGTTLTTVKSTPNSKKTPGFEAIFAVIGLVILSLILRRDTT